MQHALEHVHKKTDISELHRIEEPFVVIEEAGSTIKNFEVQGFDQSADAKDIELPPLPPPPEARTWLGRTLEEWNYTAKKIVRYSLSILLILNALRIIYEAMNYKP